MNHITGEHSGLPNSSGRISGNDDELVLPISPESFLNDPSRSNVHDPSGSNVQDPSGSNVQNPSRINVQDPNETNLDNEELVSQQESQLRRSNRVGISRRRFDIEGEAFMILPQEDEEPRNIKEALQCPAKEKWMKAMEEEMESMRSNQVWKLVDLPKGRKAIGNKWVLKIKRNADGNIERYKARLVAKGYTQQEGIDYEETFSPVVRFTSIRLILAIVANMDLELHQMDVKTAFLNGELDKEIYMEQPVGFIKENEKEKVCRLLKSIYGLKQSSRQWYIRFHNTIISNDFTMIDEDHCVYTKRNKDQFVILSFYVDDILIAGNDKEFFEKHQRVVII